MIEGLGFWQKSGREELISWTHRCPLIKVHIQIGLQKIVYFVALHDKDKHACQVMTFKEKIHGALMSIIHQIRVSPTAGNYIDRKGSHKL